MKSNKHIYLTLALMTSVCCGAAENPDSATVDLGFGIISRQDNSTAATASISGDELRKTGAIRLSDALYGKLPGLTVLANGGFNSGTTLNIRGYQSLNDNGMICLVDGVPRSIDNLTVEEVESVTVLKDAAAVAALGYRGVNGALMVKTRRGKDQKMTIDVNYNHRLSFDAKLPEFVDAYTYANALNEARRNDGLSAAYTPLELEIFQWGTDPYHYANINWADEVLKKTGNEDNVNISMRGGDNYMKYYVLLDVDNMYGMLKGTETNDYNSQLRFSKANIRGNLDINVTKSTQLRLNMLANFIETARPAGASADDIIYQVFRTPASAYPIYTSNGIFGGSPIYTDHNPVAMVSSTGRTKTHQRGLFADAHLYQDLSSWIPGLTAAIGIAYDNTSTIEESHKKSFQYAYQFYNGEIGDPRTSTIYTFGDAINTLQYSKGQTGQFRSTHFDVWANYSRRIDVHNIGIKVIYNTESEVGYGRFTTWNRQNILGHIHYDWNERLLADLTLAGNGSNLSYPHKWSFSPTLGLAWRIITAKDQTALNSAKIRLSGGIQHSDFVLENGLWMENYNGGHGDIVLKPSYESWWGTYLSYYPLTSFDLETAKKANLGLDLTLFNSLNLSIDGFYNRRSNIMMLANDLNSWVVGRPNSYAPEAEVDNYGVEVGTWYTKRISRDFSLNLAGNFTWGRNKIHNYIEIPDEPYQSHAGQRIDQAYGLEAIGFFADYAEISNSPQQLFCEVKPGDTKYKDQNGDGVINSDDYVFMGYGQNIPDINYAFTIGVNYKGFGLSATFQGVDGLTKYLGTTGVWRCVADNNNLSQHYLDNCWRPDGSNTAPIYPRLSSQNNENNNQSSSVWYTDIHWLKLRDIALTYDFPKSLLDKTFIKGAQIYVKGQNLLCWSSFSVMDPENIHTSYPMTKNILVGFNLNF